jgi:hypothetical protein
MTSVELRSVVLDDQIETKTYPVRFGPVDRQPGRHQGHPGPGRGPQPALAYQTPGPLEIHDEDKHLVIGKVLPGHPLPQAAVEDPPGWDTRSSSADRDPEEAVQLGPGRPLGRRVGSGS